jgi:hypothetical protein
MVNHKTMLFQERATICTTTIEVNNSSIVHLAAEVPHLSIIDASLQKVLTQSQLSGGLDDEPPSQILLTNLCCNVMLAHGECFAGDIKDRVLHCQVTLVTFCMLGTCHSSIL